MSRVVHDKSTSSVTPEGSSTSTSPAIIAIIVILTLLVIKLASFVTKWIIRKLKQNRRIHDLLNTLSDKEIEEFLSGEGMSLEGSAVDGDFSAEILAKSRPYNVAYEIPRSKIKLDQKSPLGTGAFGIVYKGCVQVHSVSDNVGEFVNIKEIPAAVKTATSGTTISLLRSLLQEVKVMLYIGKHEHVVQIIGCCTENLRIGEIFIVLEFCVEGSLEGFLLANQDRFMNYVLKGRLDGDRWNNENKTNSKSKIINSKGVLKSFNIFYLLRWCLEIASGMEFLVGKKVIHGDLAARNVLLNKNFQAKISDFGLSRQLYSNSEYVKTKQEPLPWRWMAIESLTHLHFSAQSDVWSFGVLCWEIFSLGEKPFPGEIWNDAFLQKLKKGLRPVKPTYAISEWYKINYNLMSRCWDEMPSKRPSFSEIYKELQEMLARWFVPHNHFNPCYVQIDVEQN